MIGEFAFLFAFWIVKQGESDSSATAECVGEVFANQFC